MIIAVTGHRPNKLWGYDNNAPQYIRMKNEFKRILIENKADVGISGMALGVDTIFAQAVLELKSEGYNIKLLCAIPCKNHSSQWIQESKDIYDSILRQADDVVIVTNATYSAYLMQVRNKYMVDKADKIIAVWDGTAGGTANCVGYARTKNKEIIRLRPKNFEI